MEAIAENARLKYFDDLRPTNTYRTSDVHDGGLADVVALAIQESSSPGPGEPVLLYYVIELDEEGYIVDDSCYPEDIRSALSHIEEFPGAEWEELRLADGEVSKFIRNRLAQSPQR